MRQQKPSKINNFQSVSFGKSLEINSKDIIDRTKKIKIAIKPSLIFVKFKNPIL
tara:strand:+ start:2327 stop:2488 length:162 start_codon:yes stop_codon:yes gene_type:complete